MIIDTKVKFVMIITDTQYYFEAVVNPDYNRNDFYPIMNWCNEQFGNALNPRSQRWGYQIGIDHRMALFIFANKEDAMLFKLFFNVEQTFNGLNDKDIENIHR